jgi:hypothetical protein
MEVVFIMVLLGLALLGELSSSRFRDLSYDASANIT